ncbi:MAG: stage II sporulation protein P, partial [Oscillospiraceae bacterium]
ADNGYLNMPNYKKNLRFASQLQNSMETLYQGLTRPILFDYRNYNQQLSTGSVLIEVGSHANTLEEAQNSAKLIAYSIANMFEKV